jgi:hypothetical protein
VQCLPSQDDLRRKGGEHAMVLFEFVLMDELDFELALNIASEEVFPSASLGNRVFIDLLRSVG